MKLIVGASSLILLIAALAFAEGSAGSSEPNRRGLITSSNCPFSCLDLGLKSDNCRQWTSGSKCYVEDYTQPAGHRSMFRVRQDQYIAPAAKKQPSAAKKQPARSALNRPWPCDIFAVSVRLSPYRTFKRSMPRLEGWGYLLYGKILHRCRDIVLWCAFQSNLVILISCRKKHR